LAKETEAARHMPGNFRALGIALPEKFPAGVFFDQKIRSPAQSPVETKLRKMNSPVRNHWRGEWMTAYRTNQTAALILATILDMIDMSMC